MKNNMLSKTLVMGVVVLFIGTCILPGISGKTDVLNVEADSPVASSVVSDSATLTFHTFDKSGEKQKNMAIPADAANEIHDMLEELKHKITYEPRSDETKALKIRFVDLLDMYGLIPKGLSKDYVLSLLNPSWLNSKQRTPGVRPVFPLLRNLVSRILGAFANLQQFFKMRFGNAVPLGFDENIISPSLPYSETGTSAICSMASGGYGGMLPLIMPPRPRGFVMWSAAQGETFVAELLTGNGFIAEGEQSGFALGFWGLGLTVAVPGYYVFYGFLGYALFTSVSADNIEFFIPPNHAPVISDEKPFDGKVDVPLSLSELSFRIEDGDGDLMNYTVTTNPDVGTGSGNNKGNGVYSVPVSGLEGLTEYSWHVEVNDGLDTTFDDFSFTTEAVAPVITNPSPSDGAMDVSVSLSQLSFYLKDFQGDLMDYTVTTVPDIGSGSGSGVGEGTYSVPVSGLDYSGEYVWYVTATDGEHETNKVFSFKVEHVMVFDPFDMGWQYRKEIIVDHTKVDGDLSSFPVLISVVDVDLRDKAQFDGDDILFMDNIGVANRLFHEIEYFDGGSGELVAWVNIPSISSSVDTSFYMYYGNSESYSQQSTEKVWNSHYLFVSHMSSIGTTIYDSTFNGNDGTKDGVNAPEEVNGKIGKCQDFDKDNSEHIVLDSAIDGLPAITVEAWEATRSLDEAHVAHNICTMFGSDGDGDIAWRFRSGVDKDFVIDTWKNEGPIGHATGGTAKLDVTWQWIVGTWTGSECYLYVNSIEVADDQSASGTMSSHPNMKTTIGGLDFPYGTFHDGKLDEIRISDTARSDDWISTSYSTMNDPLNFFSVGSEESAP